MVYEVRKQSMAWMETDYSKHTHFRWKIKWRLELLGALGIMGEAAPLITCTVPGGNAASGWTQFEPEIISSVISYPCVKLQIVSSTKSEDREARNLTQSHTNLSYLALVSNHRN